MEVYKHYRKRKPRRRVPAGSLGGAGGQAAKATIKIFPSMYNVDRDTKRKVADANSWFLIEEPAPAI
jgi:allophanate hydrolase subunit 1